MNDVCHRTLLEPPCLFQALPTGAVRTNLLPLKGALNSIWDFYATPNGRFFAALCGEFHGSDTATLFEYHPENGNITEQFDVGPACLHVEGAIPPSKIHTSIQSLDDDRLIMATHTTAPAKHHPGWMFDGYFGDPFEGYPGSHVLIWDLRRKQVVSLGIPVPRESIYGAVYHPGTHFYWFTGFLKGHLYRMNLESREVQDFGQITEFASYKLSVDAAGNIYTASRTGHLFRIDPITAAIDDLGVIPSAGDRHPMQKAHRLLAHSVNGADGKMYFVVHFSTLLFAITPGSDAIEVVGDYIPAEFDANHPSLCSGLACDADGRFWLAHTSPYLASSGLGQAVHLISWDVRKGGKPIWHGMVGSPERIASTCAKLLYDASGDRLLVADSNHGPDPAAIHSISLSDLRSGRSDRCPVWDPVPYGNRPESIIFYPGNDYATAVKRHLDFDAVIAGYIDFANAAANMSIICRESQVVRFWEAFGRDNAGVVRMEPADSDSLYAWLQSSKKAETQCVRLFFDGHWQIEQRPIPPRENLASGLILPTHPGRGHLSTCTARVVGVDGAEYFGTSDGLLLRRENLSQSFYCCGAAVVHGPVCDLTADPLTGGIFGVGGHPKDLGMLFFYHVRCGLHRLGRLQFSTFNGPVTGGPPAASSRPTCVTTARGGEILAIGVADALGCIYLLKGVKTPRLGV